MLLSDSSVQTVYQKQLQGWGAPLPNYAELLPLNRQQQVELLHKWPITHARDTIEERTFTNFCGI